MGKESAPARCHGAARPFSGKGRTQMDKERNGRIRWERGRDERES